MYVLCDTENDPRTIDNILDVNHTCDDLHAWLAPYTAGRDHLIYMEFDEVRRREGMGGVCFRLSLGDICYVYCVGGCICWGVRMFEMIL